MIGGDVVLELARFAWGAPDRLEVAGTFTGLDAEGAAPAVLILSGAGRTHRLLAAGDGAPEDGRPWRAAFVWEDAPEAFETAVLQVGDELAVDLPEPGDDTEPVELPARPAAPELLLAPSAGADRVRLEAELLAAAEGRREAESAAARAEEELRRVRADLQLEREERAADVARFRDGLAQVRAAAEEALANARAELDVAVAFRTQLEESSQAEIAELREQLEVAEAAATSTAALRARVDRARALLDEDAPG